MQLENIFQALNAKHFESSLPLPILTWNSRLRATSGRFTPGTRQGERATIEVASYLQSLTDGETHIRGTVLHEMIHFWLWHRHRPYGHTPEFHKKMRETQAPRYNPVPQVRPIRHYYECIHCKELLPARRKLKNMACYTCCKKFNDGYYDKKYRLRLRKDITKPKQEAEPKPPMDLLPETGRNTTPSPLHQSQLQELRKIVEESILKIDK